MGTSQTHFHSQKRLRCLCQREEKREFGGKGEAIPCTLLPTLLCYETKHSSAAGTRTVGTGSQGSLTCTVSNLLACDTRVTCLNQTASCLGHCGSRRCVIVVPLLFPSPFSPFVGINRWNSVYELKYGLWALVEDLIKQLRGWMRRTHWLPPSRQGADVTRLSKMG